MARRRKTDIAETKASERQLATVLDADARARVWDLHLRGWSFSAIGREVGAHRVTVSKIVREVYHELGQDRQAALESAQEEAIAHLRHVQRQAWADHDTDDERERAVLALALSDAQAAEESSRHPSDMPQPAVRFTSQRAQYLRVALDCEKEIARLRGLYAISAPTDESAQFIFRIERVEPAQPPAVQLAPSVAALGLPEPLGDDV